MLILLMMAPFFSLFKSRQIRLALLGGLLVGFVYIPFSLPISIFCWVPLWLCIAEAKTWKQVAIYSWITQFILALVGFYWIASVAHEYAFLPWWLSILVLLGYAALFHLHFVLAALVVFAVRAKTQLSKTTFVFFLAPVWLLFETFFPQIFPWNMGYPLLYRGSGWSQIADVIGFSGLSFLVYLGNTVVFRIWLSPKQNVFRRLGLILVTVLGFEFAGNFFRARAIPWEQTDNKIETLLVQANIPNVEKVMAQNLYSGTADIARKFFELTDLGLKKYPSTELVIWPETAFPDYLDPQFQNRVTTSLLTQYLIHQPFSLLTGAFSETRGPHHERLDYNSVFLFGPQGLRVFPPYHKSQLLAFGEYVPLSGIFPSLKAWNPGGPGWDAGDGPHVFRRDFDPEIPPGVAPHVHGNIGVQICYEGLDPGFSRKLSLDGADLFINVTNDSWFGDTAENQQHLYMTLARALEFRRPLIRSTNTGISAAILASGKIVTLSPSFTEWVEGFSVPYRARAEETFYARAGFFLPHLILLLTLLGLARNFILKKKEHG